MRDAESEDVAAMVVCRVVISAPYRAWHGQRHAAREGIATVKDVTSHVPGFTSRTDSGVVFVSGGCRAELKSGRTS